MEFIWYNINGTILSVFYTNNIHFTVLCSSITITFLLATINDFKSKQNIFFWFYINILMKDEVTLPSSFCPDLYTIWHNEFCRTWYSVVNHLLTNCFNAFFLLQTLCILSLESLNDWSRKHSLRGFLPFLYK